MAATVAKNQDSEVHITFDDQQQINKFARFNARLQDFREEQEQKKKELQNLEDATDELLMVEDESALIPYQIGEVFVHSTLENTNKMLEEAKENLKKEIADLETRAEQHKKILSELKVSLYAKFGNNINLEADEE